MRLVASVCMRHLNFGIAEVDEGVGPFLPGSAVVLAAFPLHIGKIARAKTLEIKATCLILDPNCADFELQTSRQEPECRCAVHTSLSRSSSS
mmetsp:Transcript_65517/g.116231  ORF Transcript_65517/g.116231 Transcript_65517/m.116231 type:complete len:92 (-) Transcript_65517:1545-1820(-)